jgi:hypothetical protein
VQVRRLKRALKNFNEAVAYVVADDPESDANSGTYHG